MRIRVATIVIGLVGLACASTPRVGTLGEGSAHEPRILEVDTGSPPRYAVVQLQEQSFVALVLVAPGHSATLLYPDSTTENRLASGTHRLDFAIPDLLIRRDTTNRQPGSERIRARTRLGLSAIPPETPTFLLLVTSPQALSYPRLFGVTAGVSIPLVESEALSAVAKAIKSTIASEPRAWAGAYQLVELLPRP
ncbi:MAG: hypothetical protein WD801_09875 [Gemmatimonadaceae bacterium]